MELNSKIFTGYFAKAKEYASQGLTPISIARYSPKWYNGARYIKLAPYPYMLKMGDEEYTRLFNNILFRLNPEEVIKELNQLAGGKSIVLLCYEKYPEFCHRHLVAKWLNQYLPTNEKIVEYIPKKLDEQTALWDS